MKRATLSILIATICGSAYADFTILDPASQPAAPPTNIQSPPKAMPSPTQAPVPVASLSQKIPTVPAANMT